MADKCFCYLNEYEVKDANARSNIELLKTRATTIENTLPTKADKTYVDNAINNIDIPEATAKGYYYMDLPLGNVNIGSEVDEDTILPTSTHQKFKEFIDNINTNNVREPKLIIANTTDSLTNSDGTVVNNPLPRYLEMGNLFKDTTLEEGKTYYILKGTFNTRRGSVNANMEPLDCIATMYVVGTDSDTGFTVEEVKLMLKMCVVPTKDYINEVVNKNPIYFIDLSEIEFKTFGSSYNNEFSTEDKTLLENLINNKIEDTTKTDIYVNGLFVFKFKNKAMALSNGILYVKASSNFSMYLRTITTDISNSDNNQGYSDYVNSIYANLTYNSSTLKVSIDKFSLTYQDTLQSVNKTYIQNNVLTKSNTTSYTPSSNYHPATKKYVDDKVASIETGGEVDLTNYYNKTETDTLLNNKANTTHTHTKSEITDFPSIPTKTSDLTNDSGFLTSHQDISVKVDTTTYNTKMTSLDNSISSINTSINSLNSKSHQVLSGTSDPTSSQGNDGDIYIKYEE